MRAHIVHLARAGNKLAGSGSAGAAQRFATMADSPGPLRRATAWGSL